MAIIEPQLSAELHSELNRAHLLHTFVMEAFPSTFMPASDRVTLLAAKTHLADDLYGSILYLLSAGTPYDGGAFALVRPLVEASVEGLWQFYCASEATFRRAYAGEDVDPGLPNMMDELDKHLGERVFGGLRTNVKTLHGFTHGGIEQLGRRFDNEGNLHPNYSDQEKRTAIQVASATYVLLSSIFCKEASDSPNIDERSIAIETRYTELYRTAG